MRLALVQIGQETNSFNPLSTTLRDFAAFGLYRGQEMLEKLTGIGTVGGYISAVGESGLDIETLPVTRGWAGAGGRITTEARQYFEDLVSRGLATAGKIDGLVIQLHGACAAEGVDDVEGKLLSICRRVLGDRVPVVLTLDHHANITQLMISNCDALVGYRTQPHDPLQTAMASTNLMLRIAAGDVRPTMAWRKLRLLAHQEQYLTSAGPMQVWFDRARELERDRRVLTISNFPMQPWLDVEEGGWSTVVVTDDDQALAERLADELADLAWSMRAEFQVKDSISPEAAVKAAAEAADGVVVLSDTGDSIFGGAAGDSTVLLEAMLQLRIKDRALVPMVDPSAVAVLAAAGPSAVVDLAVGGNASGFFLPLNVSGTVRLVADGHVKMHDHSQHEVDMGRTVVFDVGPVTMLISELGGIGGNHPEIYRAFGIEPFEYKMAVLKTASNFQYFAPISSRVIRVDTPGPSQSDIADLPWRRVPRPIYPLDRVDSWRG